MKNSRLHIRKLTIMAALTSAALIIFIIEAQIPLPIAIPGAKLGLANVITLFVLFYSRKDSGYASVTLKNTDAFIILILRIFLGAIFAGRFLTLLLSLGGGMLSFVAQVLIKKIVSDKQIWVCGAIGGVFHNIGQILIAMLIMETTAIIAYLPILIIIGIVTGTITGLVAQIVLSRISVSSNY